MNKDFLEGLAALVNVKAEDVAELYVTEGEETKLKEDVNPLEVVKSWVKTRLDDTWKASQRKTATQFENAIKSNGFDSDLQGVELLNAFLEDVKAKPGEGGEGNNPSEWEKKYQSLEASHTKALEQLKSKDAEIQKAIKEGHRREVAAKFENDVRETLGDKWAGSKDHLKILMNNFDLSRVKYDGDTPVLLDESGEPLKDELHRPIVFADQVKHYGTLIGGFHKIDPNKGGPPRSEGGGGNSDEAITLRKGMTTREYNALYDSTKDPEKRKQLAEARVKQLAERQ